jgi:nickel-dependent lactate racemase
MGLCNAPSRRETNRREEPAGKGCNNTEIDDNIICICEVGLHDGHNKTEYSTLLGTSEIRVQKRTRFSKHEASVTSSLS